MNHRQRIRAWLQLARLSNLPTVVSNTLAALALTWMAGGLHGPTTGTMALVEAALGLVLAMALIYVAGMVLNDLLDFRWDQQNRPQRPLVQAGISRHSALGLAVICLAVAVGVLALYPLAVLGSGLLLVFTVWLYNATHKKWPTCAPLLMGGCRALIFVTVAGAWLTPLSGDWWMVVGVGAISGGYTVGISLIARHESQGRCGPARMVALAMLLLPWTALLWMDTGHGEAMWMIAAAMVLVVGLGRVALRTWRPAPDPVAVVHGLLAGFCLVDAWWMALAGWPVGVVLAWGCFVLTLAAHRYIAGT